MEGFPILLFIVAIIISILGDVKKRKGPQRGPPPRQTPRPREPVARPRTQLPAPDSGRTAGTAAEMIPEDFWAELTGQARRPPAPVEPEPREVSSWDEAVAEAETEYREQQKRPEAYSLEDYRRPEVVHVPPPLVNRDLNIPTVEQRHRDFHRKVDTSVRSVPATVSVTPTNPWLLRLRQHGAAREGVVMAEIFGRPKGLEDDTLYD